MGYTLTSGLPNLPRAVYRKPGTPVIEFKDDGSGVCVVPLISTTALNSLTDGVAFSQTIDYLGSNPMVFDVSAGTLPAGLTLSAAGVLSGVPTTAGAYNFTARATNACGNDTQAFSGTVASSTGEAVYYHVSVTVDDMVVGVALVDYYVALEWNGVFAQPAGNFYKGWMGISGVQGAGTTPTFAVVSGGLPPGISLAASGVLSGTPTLAGTYSAFVRMSNAFTVETAPDNFSESDTQAEIVFIVT